MSEHYHFMFVHGAGHGGRCWYKLANSLRESGHKATCIDLKGAGINPTDPNTVSTLDDYDQPLYDFLSLRQGPFVPTKTSRLKWSPCGLLLITSFFQTVTTLHFSPNLKI
ncbi:unnamed protein product [Microthlaspi erraticum]|uniref:AB hydrolase-1 domain-containing protein n=1 Tax=Microthlaspi erraticum TaxID=1685480 RepID=A0A6D2J045_9BRAS|nr:unnamed protein product [Microthlaspi erraticum]